MPAGGFKTFVDGEVLSANDINDYLMQGIIVFPSEASRDSSISGPDHGMFAFTTDNNRLWYYDGSSWVDFTPDVEFASIAARDLAIPNPVDGRYAYTTDREQLWKYVTSAWVQQQAPRFADFSNTATGTVTVGTDNYKYISFTTVGTHTLTITREGFAEVLVVGGGGGGGAGNGEGGNGGNVRDGIYRLPSGAITVTVGAGGAASSSGDGNPGGAGGASSIGAYVSASGGVGGIGTVSLSASTGYGFNISSSITGSPSTYSVGGLGHQVSPTAGTSNTGNGGQGGGGGGLAGAAGGSGVVIVRVRTN